MNSQSDKKPAAEPSTGERSTGIILPLVPPHEREREALPTASDTRRSPTNQNVQRPSWDGDDDDPGPTAA